MFTIYYITDKETKLGRIEHPGFTISHKSTNSCGKYNRIISIKSEPDNKVSEDEIKAAVKKAFDLIPKNATNIELNLNQLQLCPEVIAELPKQFTTLKLTAAEKIDIAEIKKVIQNIPDHITSISLPNLFEAYSDDELASIFRTFHEKLKLLSIGEFDYEEKSIEDERLKKSLIHLPVSVEEVTVPHQPFIGVACAAFRCINMDELFFPKSYREITEELHDEDLFEQALAILKDYTKIDSCFSGAARFFSGHWNRHHIDEVDNVIKKEKTLPALLDALHKIQLVNPIGSLARRIRFIERLAYENENKKEKSRLQFSSSA